MSLVALNLVTLNTFRMVCNHHCYFQNFYIISNKNSVPIRQQFLIVLFFLLPVTCSAFCLCEFSYSRFFIWAESYNICPFLRLILLYHDVFRVHPELTSFLWQNSFVYSFSVDSVFSFYLLWLMKLLPLVWKYLFESVFISGSCGYSMFNFLKNP